jgi:hypothetical protein
MRRHPDCPDGADEADVPGEMEEMEEMDETEAPDEGARMAGYPRRPAATPPDSTGPPGEGA